MHLTANQIIVVRFHSYVFENKLGNNLIGRMLNCGFSRTGSIPVSHQFIFIIYTPIAQLVERVAVNYKVIGSNPIWCFGGSVIG